MTTVGFGDFIPRTSNILTILSGLCFMSGTMDAIVSYAEKNERKTLFQQIRWTRSCCCCNKNVPSINIRSSFENQTIANQNNIEVKEKDCK
jgi:hypothetical protein